MVTYAVSCLSASTEQHDLFKTLYEENVRSVQPGQRSHDSTAAAAGGGGGGGAGGGEIRGPNESEVGQQPLVMEHRHAAGTVMRKKLIF